MRDYELLHEENTVFALLLPLVILAVSSAVLELLVSESVIFRFRTIWGPKSADEFRRWGNQSVPYQISGHRAQSSAQNKFISRFQKIAPF